MMTIEGDYKEVVERDKLIYDSIVSRYNIEWDRFKIIDGKASGIVSFVGIITGLMAGMGAILLNGAPRTPILFTIMECVFIVGIILLTISIGCGLKSYYVRTWKFVPEAQYLIEEYGKKIEVE